MTQENLGTSNIELERQITPPPSPRIRQSSTSMLSNSSISPAPEVTEDSRSTYPKQAKVLANFFTLTLIAFIWATIGGVFSLWVLSYWESGGSFGSWDRGRLFFGLVVLIGVAVILGYFSIICYKRLYLWNLDFIYLEIRKRELRNPIEELKMKHNKEKSKWKIKNEALSKRNKKLIEVLITYEVNKQQLMSDVNE